MPELHGVDRRSLLRRGLLVLAGLVGGRVAAHADGAEASRVAPPSPAGTRSWTVRARNLSLRAASQTGPALLREPDRFRAHGELVGSDGTSLGQFFAASFHVHSPYGDSPFEATSLDMHTFTFADGSIVGMGAGQVVGARESVYAIVGGTGKYLGARGSYTARQSPRGLGGDGSAEFTFTLLG